MFAANEVAGDNVTSGGRPGASVVPPPDLRVVTTLINTSIVNLIGHFICTTAALYPEDTTSFAGSITKKI